MLYLMYQVATDEHSTQEIFKMNIKSIEPLEFVDNEAHVEGGVGYRWIGSKNGKHTDTSAWHLSYGTALTNAKIIWPFTLEAFVVSTMYNYFFLN